MVTRGEGGGNAVGTELGPALGLRRENEDRIAHYRSGHRRHLQPRPRRLLLQHERAADPVLLGPGRDAAPDHADHPHDAARHLHRLHADARRRPRQPPAGRPLHLGGRARRGRPDDVPRAARRGRTRSARGRSRRSSPAGAPPAPAARPRSADCTTGFVPSRDATSTRSAGVWTGYDSPYLWPPGNVQGQAGRHAEDLGAGRRRGQRGIPDAEPRDEQGHVEPGLLALRPDRGLRAVPAEHESGRHGEPARRAGRRDPLRRDRRRIRAACPPGRSSTSPSRASSTCPAPPSRRPCTSSPAARTLPSGTVALTVPSGWTVEPAEGDRPDLSRGRVDRDVHRHPARRRRPSTRTTRSPRSLTSGEQDGLHGQRRPDRRRRSRAGSSAGASGRSTTAGSRTSPRRRRGSGDRRPTSRSASARRSPCRSTSTTGRTRPRAARSRLTLPANFTADATLEAVRPARAGRATRRSTSR